MYCWKDVHSVTGVQTLSLELVGGAVSKLSVATQAVQGSQSSVSKRSRKRPDSQALSKLGLGATSLCERGKRTCTGER